MGNPVLSSGMSVHLKTEVTGNSPKLQAKMADALWVVYYALVCAGYKHVRIMHDSIVFDVWEELGGDG